MLYVENILSFAEPKITTSGGAVSTSVTDGISITSNDGGSDATTSPASGQSGDDCHCVFNSGNDPVNRNAYLTATVLAIIFGLTLLVILVVFAVTMTRRYVSKCCLHNVFMYVLH